MELAQHPQYEGMRVALKDGVLLAMPKPGGRHGVVGANILGFLWQYVRQHKLGWVTTAETGFITRTRPDGRQRIRGLDVAFVTLERAPDGLPVGPVPFSPDLAVEVISDSNTAADIHEKVLELLNEGTRLIRLIYPESQTVMVYTPTSTTLLTAADSLSGDKVLSGVSLPIKDIF